MFSKAKKIERVDNAFKKLKGNFYHQLNPNDKIIEFVATNGKINKTSIILNLARRLAKDGKKVIMIEADMRNPKLSEISKVELNRGFYDIITYATPYENLITNDLYQKNLKIILAAKIIEDEAQIINPNKLDKVFNLLRQNYDYVLIDVPVFDNFEDAGIIGPTCDAVFMLNRYSERKKKRTKELMNRLEDLGANIKGIILTNCR